MPADTVRAALMRGGPLLVTGAAGIGKTRCVLLLARKLGYTVTTIVASELEQRDPGYPERAVAAMAQTWTASGPHMVIWDRMDELVPRDVTPPPLVRAIVATLQDRRWPLCVHVGVAIHERLIDKPVRDCFDDIIRLELPTKSERLELLHELCGDDGGGAYCIHAEAEGMTLDQAITQLNNHCHGFVFTDMLAIFADAQRRAMVRVGYMVVDEPSSDLPGLLPSELMQARRDYRPRGLATTFVPRPVEPVPWDSIGGLEAAKATLQDALVWSQGHQEDIVRMGIRPPRGLLMFGPPGTGKTLLAKAAATAMQGQFLAATIPDLLNGEVGESEKAIARLFAQARRNSPCLIFLDEMEALFGTKESDHAVTSKMISQVLLELDNLEHAKSPDEFVFVLAATNAPEKIDEAFLRPGRLDSLLYIGPPMAAERAQILSILFAQMRMDPLADPTEIIAKTEGFTGADLYALCQRAAMAAIDRISSARTLSDNSTSINMSDFMVALAESTPSIQPGDLLRYLSFTSV